MPHQTQNRCLPESITKHSNLQHSSTLHETQTTGIRCPAPGWDRPRPSLPVTAGTRKAEAKRYVVRNVKHKITNWRVSCLVELRSCDERSPVAGGIPAPSLRISKTALGVGCTRDWHQHSDRSSSPSFAHVCTLCIRWSASQPRKVDFMALPGFSIPWVNAWPGYVLLFLSQFFNKTRKRRTNTATGNTRRWAADRSWWPTEIWIREKIVDMVDFSMFFAMRWKFARSGSCTRGTR